MTKYAVNLDVNLNFSLILTQRYFIFLFVLAFTSASSQEVMLDGQVQTDFDADVEGIHVYNISSEKGTLTNPEGTFRITAALGDSLVISGVQFHEVSLVISSEDLIRKKLIVPLKSKTTELDEIYLKNHNLSGSLNLDSKTIPTQEHISTVTLGITEKEVIPPSPEVRQLYTAQSGILDPLINAISGRTKMLKKRVKLAKDNRIIAGLLEKFPEDFLRENFHLEKQEDVYDFLYFCEADPRYTEAVTKNSIAILDFLTLKAKEYHQLKEGE